MTARLKKVKNYTYEGFGFPIIIKEVELVSINGNWSPIVDIKKLANKTIYTLACQPNRLTGDQVRFIRHYLSMSVAEFSRKIAKVSTSTVRRWENKKGTYPATTRYSSEESLRIEMINELTSRSRLKEPIK